jgi:hypothetical protein
MSVTVASAAGWLLHCAVGGGLLLLLTWALMRATRQPARQQRLGEWGLAAALVVAGLGLGPAWLVLPWVPAPEPAAAARPAEPPPAPAGDELVPAPADVFAPPAEVPPAAALPGEQAPVPAPRDPLPAAAAPLPTPGELAVGLVVLVYAAGAALLLARWLLGYAAVARLLRGAIPAPAAVGRLFAEVAGDRPPRLLVSSRVRVPLCCGLWRPTVLLPAALCPEPDEERLRWVFAHELTHLRRRDGWSGLLFGLGQVVYFYLPWFWAVRRQVRLCQEYVADAAAVGGAGQPADYAEFLLSLTAAPALPTAATGVSGRSSDLFRRVTMLLQNPLRVEPRCPRRWLLAAAGGLLGLAVVAGGTGVRAEDGPVIIIVTGAGAPQKASAKAADGPRVLVVPADKQADKHILVLTERLLDLTRKAQPAPEGVRVIRGREVVANPVKALPGQAAKAPAESAAVLRQLLLAGPAGAGRKIPEAELDALRKAVKKLEGNPDRAALEEVRKEIQRVLEKVQAREKVLELRPVREWVNAVQPGQPVYGWAYAADPRRGRLGIHVEKPTATLAEQLDLPKDQGLVVTAVYHDMPAGKAGLKVNDVLLELGGRKVPSDPEGLAKLVGTLPADRGLDVVLVRRGRRETVTGLKLAAGPVRVREVFGLTQPYRALPPAGVPVVPGSPYRPALPPPGVRANPAAGGGVLTTTFRNGDRFTSRYQEGSLIITVTGTVADGKAKVSEVHVQDGSASSTYGMDNVPARYRDKVDHLLQGVGRGTIHVETK